MKLENVAKLTHARYGTNNHPDTGLTRQKTTVVSAIASHISPMFTCAQPIWCITKNTGDHVVFNANCTTHPELILIASMFTHYKG